MLISLDTVRPDHLGCYGYKDAALRAVEAGKAARSRGELRAFKDRLYEAVAEGAEFDLEEPPSRAWSRYSVNGKWVASWNW